MPRDELAKIRQILENVIKKGYPELLSCDIQIEYENLDDALAECQDLKPEGYNIKVDESLKPATASVKTGVLASELSHIIDELNASSLDKLKDGFLYKVSKSYRIKDERNTDVTTILRGFGKELLEVMRFAEENGFPYYREDGMSSRELEVLLSKK